MCYIYLTGKHEDRKVAAIGQAIVQAARPRSTLAPLQIGLAIQTHHMYRSRLLLDTLHNMGFAASFKEVLRFEKNAANMFFEESMDLTEVPDLALLFAADNVDHNTATLDGKNTFHGMGMIAAYNPSIHKHKCMPRKNTSSLDLVDKCKINIIDYRFSQSSLKEVKFQPLIQTLTFNNNIDLLWEVSFNFKNQAPCWQGMMHGIHKEVTHQGPFSILFLPMIDMQPTDKTCILSTLLFLNDLAKGQRVSPVITFDQPLFWKASEIISSAPGSSDLKNIVLRLGSFHTLMNVLGAIGTLMEGSGLSEILGTIYGENALPYIINGKAVQRALRGHMLIEKELNRMIVEKVLLDDPNMKYDIEDVETKYEDVMNGKLDIDGLVRSMDSLSIKKKIEEKRGELASRSKTSSLWLHYMDMIRVARALIQADRTGSWNDHLGAISAALPIFAATGHFNYLKSAYLYLQQMMQLQDKHPDVHQIFMRGNHVIRRTNQGWAGMGCDLVIEQSLMKSVKSHGGLTHGSKMSDEQRALWTLSAHLMSQVNASMRRFTGLENEVEKVHTESRESRMRRDHEDLSQLSLQLQSASPFSEDPSLRNIVSGVVASDDVNVHEYESVGKQVIEKMIGNSVFTVSFSRKDKVKTIGYPSAVKVSTDRTIDPDLLFQRFLVVSNTGELSMDDILKHELNTYPPALFEAIGVMRKADKPQLAHSIYEHCSSVEVTASGDSPSIPITEHYVLDGGSLLHRLHWNVGSSYEQIAKMYADHTVSTYGPATVVFDGYQNGPAIKDATHQRRESVKYPRVHLRPPALFGGNKNKIVANSFNKHQLIGFIISEMTKAGCDAVQCGSDADVSIVQAAVESASFKSTTVIGEDTDLLMLLLYYVRPDCKPLYLRSDNQSRGAPKVYHINTIAQKLGRVLCTRLLFLHAFTGSDSTSRIYGVGKRTAFHKLLSGNKDLNTCADVFVSKNKTRKVIERNGNNAMVALFGGKQPLSLNSLRTQTLKKKVISAKSFVSPERLPPTESCSKYHSLRVYFQVMTWMGNESLMDPLSWGWTLDGDKLVPIMTDMSAAPDALLDIVHCNCKTGCASLRCKCHSYGMPCTATCGPCQMTNCLNPLNKRITDEPNEAVAILNDDVLE